MLVASAILVFVALALPRANGVESAFAVGFLGLVAAAAFGSCSFDLRRGDRRTAAAERGALRSFLLGLLLGGAALALSGARGGPLLAALLCGLFCGLYAFTCGAVAHLLGGGLARPVVAAAALALTATLFHWDALFLFHAADRKASAATALSINPAAAIAATLGFDWIHAKALYTGNQTAESLFGVPLPGIGSYSLELLAVSVPAVLGGLWRKPR